MYVWYNAVFRALKGWMPLALASTPAQPRFKVTAHPINIGQPGLCCRPCRNSGSSIIIAHLPMAFFSLAEYTGRSVLIRFVVCLSFFSSLG